MTFVATLFCGTSAGKLQGRQGKEGNNLHAEKVTCKWLSASAAGLIFSSSQCYWLSEKIRTKQHSILCVGDKKFLIQAVSEIH